MLSQNPNIEQRNELHMEAPYAFSSCIISQSANCIEFTIDNYFWKCTDDGQITHGPIGNDGEAETLRTELSKEAYMEKLVKTFLDREGVRINDLKIKNHPHGLEGLANLKVVNFQWHCDIVSDRYDYTSWFSCIRNNTLTTADIQLNSSSHNQIFLEPVLLGAETLIVKCPEPLATQTIKNFHGLTLKLNFSSVTREFLEAFHAKWHNGWADGNGKLELELADSEARNTLRTFLIEQFSDEKLRYMVTGDFMCTNAKRGQIKFILSAGEAPGQ